MRKRRRVAVYAALLAPAAVVLAAAGASAATPTATPSATPKAPVVITYTPASNGGLTVTAASVSPSSAAEVAGEAFTFKNADTTNPITITNTSKNWKLSVTIPKGGSYSETIALSGTGYTYQAVGTDGKNVLGGASKGSGTTTGTVTVSAAPASSPPAVTPTPTRSSGGTPTRAAASSPATTTAPAASSSSAGPVVAYPGGVIPSIAPGATVNGLVQPPEIATATSTAPNGMTTTFYSTPAPVPASSTAGLVSASSNGGGGGNRSLGLPAAVTAVVLIGLLAALGRLLLAHPAARAVARRH